MKIRITGTVIYLLGGPGAVYVDTIRYPVFVPPVAPPFNAGVAINYKRQTPENSRCKKIYLRFVFWLNRSTCPRANRLVSRIAMPIWLRLTAANKRALWQG
jgi:hypothetical protein